MDERRLELKVGLLLLAAIVAVGGLLAAMGELRGRGGAALSVDFEHTGNVVPGAPVKLGGMTVGRVERLELLAARRDARGGLLPVRMHLSLEPGVRDSLHQDATASVSAQGPLGEAYLELDPGAATAPALPQDAVLRGLDPPRLDKVAQQLTAFLDSASKLLEDDPQTLSSLVRNVSSLAKTADNVLLENRDSVRTLLVDLEATVKDLRSASAFAKAQTQPGSPARRLLDDAAATAHVLREQLPGITQDAASSMKSVAAVSSRFTADDGEKLRVALQRYSAAGEKLDRLAERGERLLARLEAGQGSVGALLKDRQLYDDLKALVSDLRKHPWKVLWKE